MFNKAIIPALLVGGLGISDAGCETEFLGEPIYWFGGPKKELATIRGYNKSQTRAEELDQDCANRTGDINSTYVEVLGQRITCEQYLSLRVQGWSPTETDGLGETITAEEIIKLHNAGVSDEVILQLLKSGRGKLPR